jgi:spore germination protein YaaH
VRIGATLAMIGITTATVSTTATSKANITPVGLHDSGLAIARSVVPLPSTGVEHFVDSPTAKPKQTTKSSPTPKATPRPTPRPTPAPTPTPPPGPPAREVVGFAPYWTLNTWREWRMQDLSAIAYFAVTIDENGNTVTDDFWPAWGSQDLTDMVNAAHAAGVKVLVTVRNFDDGEIGSIVNDPDHTRVAVQTATDLMRMRGLDGVVVDFEGSDPGNSAGLVNFSAALRASVKAYRADAQYIVATYASAAAGGGMYNLPALTPTVDAFFVMAYDMASANDPAHAVPNAPLTGGQFNDTTVVAQYLAQTSADKVILGVPYYGDKWSVDGPGPNANVVDGPAPSTYSQMLDDFACSQSLSVHPEGASPWATWYSPPDGDPCGADLGTWRELYFETAATLGAKYDLVNRSNLLGTGMWALGFDTGHGELWDALQSHVTAKR